MSDNVFALLHVLAVFWYVSGLTAVQISLVRAWQSEELSVRADSLEEASHYQGVLLVAGAIAAIATGVFFWARNFNLITNGWLVLLEVFYIITLLVCIPLIGMGLRRARLAALKARKTGKVTPELEEAISDNVPLVFAGIATILLPVMAYLSIFRPF